MFTSKQILEADDLYEVQEMGCCKYRLTSGELAWLDFVTGKYDIADYLRNSLHNGVVTLGSEPMSEALDADNGHSGGKAACLSEDTALAKLMWWLYEDTDSYGTMVAPKETQKIVAGAIAPHEGQEIQLVLDGTKPLAVIELNKQPMAYRKAMDGIHGLYAYENWDDTTGWEVVIVDQRNVGLVMEYLDALNLPAGSAKHRTLGRLFGYSEADIEAFIADQPTCNCSKCTGGTNS